MWYTLIVGVSVNIDFLNDSWCFTIYIYLLAGAFYVVGYIIFSLFVRILPLF